MPVCVDVKVLVFEWSVRERKVAEVGESGSVVFQQCEEHARLCGLCVFLKGVYQSVFTGPCLVQYEGRAALPHPPINII